MTKNEVRKAIQDLAELYHMVLVKRDAPGKRAEIQADVLAELYLEKLESTIDKLKTDDTIVKQPKGKS
jgi:hypothetical protein